VVLRGSHQNERLTGSLSLASHRSEEVSPRRVRDRFGKAWVLEHIGYPQILKNKAFMSGVVHESRSYLVAMVCALCGYSLVHPRHFLPLLRPALGARHCARRLALFVPQLLCTLASGACRGNGYAVGVGNERGEPEVEVRQGYREVGSRGIFSLTDDDHEPLPRRFALDDGGLRYSLQLPVVADGDVAAAREPYLAVLAFRAVG
jgi:hypothetical protein